MERDRNREEKTGVPFLKGPLQSLHSHVNASFQEWLMLWTPSPYPLTNIFLLFHSNSSTTAAQKNKSQQGKYV